MNIKQSIALIIILMSVSFSASAYYTVTYTSSRYASEISVGSTYQHFDWMVGQTFGTKTISKIVYSYNSATPYYLSGGKHYSYGTISYNNVSQCPDDETARGEKFMCQPDLFCDLEYPDLHKEAQLSCDLFGGTVEYMCESQGNHNLECDTSGGGGGDFCSSDEFLNLEQQASSECAELGGAFFSSCEDENNYSFSCNEITEPCDPSDPFCVDEPTDPDPCEDYDPTDPNAPLCPSPEPDPEPEQCTIYSPSWPDCLPPEDPLPPAPQIPDNGGPSTNPISDPKDPIEEPPVEDTPPEEGDGDVVSSIENLNKDQNDLLTKLNNSLNDNAQKMEVHITDVNKNLIKLNEDIEHGLNSITDNTHASNLSIQEGNKLLRSLNGSVTSGLNAVTNAVNDITDINVNPDGGLDAADLYQQTDLDSLNTEVEELKTEVQTVLTDFKTYFQLSGDFNDGEFDPHNIELTKNGKIIKQENMVMKTLVDNAGVISAVILFMFGWRGSRLIVEAA